ncbi:PfkB family carbohydrate kinase, partial [Streptomyces sp. NPDC058667]|uniref:PfkB family carbohydrate kinase n=1 Tax=Streptomyces sp. NPDC058667 TaxID=3346588 RepID=UPI00364E95EF
MDLVAYVPRAPALGETVTGRSFRTVPGGKGANQAVAAARAGGEVAMIGAVGTDDFGVRLRATLEHCAVDTDLLRTATGSSGTAHIVVDEEGRQPLVVVPPAHPPDHAPSPARQALMGA